MVKQQKTRLKWVTWLKIAIATIFSVILYDFMKELSLMRQQQEEISQMITSYLSNFNRFEQRMDSTFPKIDSIPDEKIREVYTIKQKIEMMGEILEEDQRILQANFLTPKNFYQIEAFEKRIEEEDKLIDFLHTQSKQFVRKQRILFFSHFTKDPDYKEATLQNALTLISFNLQTNYMDILEKREWQDKIKMQQTQFQEKYSTNIYIKQLPLCVIVSTRNNAKYFQFESTLQSIINQDYLNYRLVIIDDASTDQTVQNVRIFLKRKKVPASKYVIIANSQRKTITQKAYSGILGHCDTDDIAVLMNGGDELIGNNVFNLLNANYRLNHAPIVYSDYLYGNAKNKQLFKGNSMAYIFDEKSKGYRSIDLKFSPLRTFKVKLFASINIDDLKQKQVWSQTQQAFLLPMLEMSCGRIQFINEVIYFYNHEAQISQNRKSPLQSQFSRTIRSKPTYQCLPQYV